VNVNKARGKRESSETLNNTLKDGRIWGIFWGGERRGLSPPLPWYFRCIYFIIGRG
jgi:hypothetical protein